jgi:hypothetical protein
LIKQIISQEKSKGFIISLKTFEIQQLGLYRLSGIQSTAFTMTAPTFEGLRLP